MVRKHVISIRPHPRCGSSPTSSSTTARHMPKFNSISISGYHMEEAGATSVQELAFTLADGLGNTCAPRCRAARHRRIRAATVVLLRIGMNFFMEIAKLRAARLLWARLIEPFAPKNPVSLGWRTHCQTSVSASPSRGRTQQSSAPTIEALAAVLGGHPVAAYQFVRRALALPTRSRWASRVTRS